MQSDDLAKLTTALGSSKVKVVTQVQFTTADKVTPVSKVLPEVHVATTPKRITSR